MTKSLKQIDPSRCQKHVLDEMEQDGDDNDRKMRTTKNVLYACYHNRHGKRERE